MLAAASGVGRCRWPAKPTWRFPTCTKAQFDTLGATISAWNLLFYRRVRDHCGTLGISLYQFFQIKKQPAHKSMLDIAEIIFQTCKTYLIQQGKFLLMLFVLIAIAMSYYLLGFGHEPRRPRRPRPQPRDQPDRHARLVLFFSVVGMGGSYCGGLVRHPRQHLRQLPAPPSPRSAASRGTWSTFRCGPACRSACS